MKRILLTTFLAICFASTTAVVHAHISDGYEPKTVHESYSHSRPYSAECEINDLTFPAHPSRDDLTQTERYMIRGTKTGPWNSGLPTWWMRVARIAMAYHEKFDSIPPVLTRQEFLDVMEGSNIPDTARIQEYYNPVTNEWPRLDATEFSAGDLYMRPLTQAEKEHIALHDDHFRNLWQKNQVYDTVGYVPIELLTDIYYVRVYGESGVIHSQLYYQYRSLD